MDVFARLHSEKMTTLIFRQWPCWRRVQELRGGWRGSGVGKREEISAFFHGFMDSWFFASKSRRMMRIDSLLIEACGGMVTWRILLAWVWLGIFFWNAWNIAKFDGFPVPNGPILGVKMIHGSPSEVQSKLAQEVYAASSSSRLPSHPSQFGRDPLWQKSWSLQLADLSLKIVQGNGPVPITPVCTKKSYLRI